MIRDPENYRAWWIDQITTLKIGVIVLATIATGFTMWALRHILEPFVLAMFLLIMVDGMARALQERVPAFPRQAALPCAIAVIVAVFIGTIWVASDNAGAFASQAPAYTVRINALLSEAASRFGLSATPTLSSLIHEVNPGRLIGLVANALSHFAEAAVFVLIYLGFLIASRRGFRAKAPGLLLESAQINEAARVFRRVRRGIESYLWVQTVVGVLITGASAILMASTGLSHIPFWCLIIFLTNYIPAIGAAIGVLFPAAFGLVEFDGIVRSLVLLAGLEAVHFTVSHVVQPRMQGQSLNLDPVVILLALAFWSAVWGVVGAFLSTPLTVVAMAVLAEFKAGRPLAVLLSSDGRPYAERPAAEPPAALE
jgi:AI-2 transport protein TqsA